MMIFCINNGDDYKSSQIGNDRVGAYLSLLKLLVAGAR
jgi:hypothetical protein